MHFHWKQSFPPGDHEAQFIHLDARRLDPYLGCQVSGASVQPIEPLRDVELTEGRLRRSDLVLLDEVSSQGKPAVPHLEGIVLVTHE